jgi:hypothetical protein
MNVLGLKRPVVFDDNEGVGTLRGWGEVGEDVASSAGSARTSIRPRLPTME